MELNRRNVLAGGLAAGLTAAVGSKTASAATPSNARVRAIGLEEHCLPPEVYDLWRGRTWRGGGIREQIGPDFVVDIDGRLRDFDGQRIEDMDRAGIEMAVLSHSVQGPQGQPDPKRAHDMMVQGNDALAQQVSKRPDRYAGFACLSMHDVDAACREFERAVKQLGFRGALLNNWQRVGDGDTILTYDDRRFDAFWATAQMLDAPVYLHPGYSPSWYARNVAGLHSMLNSAGWNWAVEVGTHALRIITTGVFDRYPRAQLILGHNGEHIPFDLWRIENRLHNGWRRQKGQPGGNGDNAMPYSGMAMDPNAPNYGAEKTVYSYFRTNVSVTTSAQFNDASLQHIIKMIGADRVMFSSDYPYEDMVEGGEWFARTPLSQQERAAIARGNQIKLLKLPLKP